MPSTPPPIPSEMSQPAMPVLPVDVGYIHDTPQRSRGAMVIGIISIVFAAMSIIGSIGVAGFGGSALITAQIHKISTAQMDEARYPLIPDETLQSPDGLDEQRAGMVVDALTKTRAMTAIRQQQVRSLARLHGKKLFPFGSEGLTVLRMKSNISESGQVRISGGNFADYYVTGSGRIEVSDTSAIFRPDVGPALRSGDIAVDRSLTEPQIEKLCNEIDASSQAKLNAAQRLTIQRLVRDPEQSIITNPDSAVAGASSQFIHVAGPLKDGGVWILTDKSQVRLTQDGTETLLSTDAPMPGNNSFTGKPAKTVWAQMVMVEAFVSLLLAVLLLIGGIFLCKGRPVGRRIHIVWAVVKIPVGLIGAWMLGLCVMEWLGSFQVADAASTTRVMTAGWTTGVLFGLTGIIWPIVTLIAMSKQSVKEQLRTVG